MKTLVVIVTFILPLQLLAKEVLFKNTLGVQKRIFVPERLGSFPGMFENDLVLIEKKSKSEIFLNINIKYSTKKYPDNFFEHENTTKVFITGSKFLLEKQHDAEMISGELVKNLKSKNSFAFDFVAKSKKGKFKLRKIYWKTKRGMTAFLSFKSNFKSFDNNWKELKGHIKKLQESDF